jgi:exopolysaccharide/PEP-CTERM locus tyrosine autokinase
MSKIQDALHWLQKQQGESAEARRERAKPETTLAASNRDRTESTVGTFTLVEPKATYGGDFLQIDLRALSPTSLVVSGPNAQQLEDEFRLIKRPVVANALGRKAVRPDRGNIVMVASALPGEGKTFTCLNLALSIARETDLSVVLIDGDCAKRELTSIFSAESQPGFLDLLKDPELAVNQFIMPTSVDSLAFMPSGRPDQQIAELFASNRMNSVMQDLMEFDNQRIVIFDSSPLLLTTEASVLSSHVGQIVLVVHSGHTAQSAVMAALERLDQSRPINAVLNRATASETESYGSYGHYGSYYRPGPDS